MIIWSTNSIITGSRPVVGSSKRTTSGLLTTARAKLTRSLRMTGVRDDGYHLIEVNPRFPAWCDLTWGAGQNQILAAVQMAMGQEVKKMTDFRAGTAFVRISIDQIVDIAELEAIATTGATFFNIIEIKIHL